MAERHKRLAEEQNPYGGKQEYVMPDHKFMAEVYVYGGTKCDTASQELLQ
jgi:hypothetical protein